MKNLHYIPKGKTVSEYNREQLANNEITIDQAYVRRRLHNGDKLKIKWTSRGHIETLEVIK